MGLQMLGVGWAERKGLRTESQKRQSLCHWDSPQRWSEAWVSRGVTLSGLDRQRLQVSGRCRQRQGGHSRGRERRDGALSWVSRGRADTEKAQSSARI